LVHTKALFQTIFSEDYLVGEMEEDIHNYYYMMFTLLISHLKKLKDPKYERLLLNNEMGLKINKQDE